jgi:hypothetical protein
MTTKERILGVIKSMADDISIEQAINHLYLLYKIEVGIKQVEAGEGIEHDEFMIQLESETA